MYRKVLLFLLVVAILTSCKYQRIHFGRASTLKVERIANNHYPLQEADVDSFASCCWMNNGNVFLNRSVVNTDSTITYISVSETMLQNEFRESQKLFPFFKIMQEKSFTTSKQKIDCYLIQNGSYFIVRSVWNELRGGLLIIQDRSTSSQQKALMLYGDIERIHRKTIKP